MTLATADAQGRPSARTVLLKAFDARGFVFYTSLTSRKAQQLAANPRAALCFFWQPLMEQALIEGSVAQVSDQEADAYWASRPRWHQLGAWASRQSAAADRRRTLTQRLCDALVRFSGRTVPRPPSWSGFRVIPDRLEFWTRGQFRLHRRVLYEQRDARWTKRVLDP